MKPLEGLKVVELGVYLAIPGVSRLLADWGAEVIKVEAPKGDASRYTGYTILKNTGGHGGHGKAAGRCRHFPE